MRKEIELNPHESIEITKGTELNAGPYEDSDNWITSENITNVKIIRKGQSWIIVQTPQGECFYWHQPQEKEE